MADIERDLVDRDERTDIELPRELPVLPISEAVIFPAMMVPLVLSDANLVRLADDCLAGDKILGAFAQRVVDEDEEEDVADRDLIYRVGTAVKIQKMLRFPDGSMRLLGQGVARCRIREFVSDEPYMKAQVELIPEERQDDSRTLAYMRGVANNFLKIIDASETLSEELKVVVMNIDDPGRLADLIATNLDIDVAEKQQILEERHPAQAAADPLQDRDARTGRAGTGPEAADAACASPSTRTSASTTCASSSRPSSANWATPTRARSSWTNWPSASPTPTCPSRSRPPPNASTTA